MWGQHRFRVPVTVPEGEYAFLLVPGYDRLWPWGDQEQRLGTVTVEGAADALVFQVPPMDVEVQANFDDKIELLGLDIAETTVRPGGVVSCTLYWRALQEINQNYTVFNHLVDASGETWGQWVSEYDLKRALVQKGSPMASFLDGLSEWDSVYEDDAYIVFQRGLPLKGR